LRRCRMERKRNAWRRSEALNQLGVSFVESVLDVRRRNTKDGKTAAPEESLKFLAQIRGWQLEDWKKRKSQLQQLNDIGLQSLERTAGTDVFLIPKEHFRRKHLSKGNSKDGGIQCGQSYCAGSAEDVMSERRALASHRKNGRKNSLPRAFSVC